MPRSWGPYHGNSLLCTSSSSHHSICSGGNVQCWHKGFSSAGSGITAAGIEAAVQPQRVSILFHFRWAVVRKMGKREVRKQKGRLIFCLAEGFTNLCSSLGSSWDGLLCLGPILQLRWAAWGWMWHRGEIDGKLAGDGGAQGSPLSITQGSTAIGICLKWAYISPFLSALHPNRVS